MSEKQELYANLLKFAHLDIKGLSVRTSRGDTAALSSLFNLIELVHNIPDAMVSVNYAPSDIWFLNYQARVFQSIV